MSDPRTIALPADLVFDLIQALEFAAMGAEGSDDGADYAHGLESMASKLRQELYGTEEAEV